MPPKKRKPLKNLRAPRISRFGHRYNWLPDLPDFRDYAFAALQKPKAPKPKALPFKIDLRPQCSPVFDQGKIGSCTGNALAGAFEFLQLQELRDKSPDAQDPEVFTPGKFNHVSRLFIYYNERDLEGRTGLDQGAALRDGVKALTQFGACRETLWKYGPAQVFKKPTAPAYKEAALHRITQYLRLEGLEDTRQCLSQGFPVAFGFSVFESFETAQVMKTGIMPMPQVGERFLGGHAVLAVGYDDEARCLIVRNSWGPKWGLKGYFMMPYEVIESGRGGAKMAQDFWTVRR
ncbi:C1 family peptidase [Bdellovibrionota bacterium FG-2]